MEIPNSIGSYNPPFSEDINGNTHQLNGEIRIERVPTGSDIQGQIPVSRQPGEYLNLRNNDEPMSEETRIRLIAEVNRIIQNLNSL